jgi:peptidoglycan hydrolase-like protein with peptidoglycan-binding domain
MKRVHIVIVVIAIAIVAAALWRFVPRTPSFCFDFLRDMYYGENKTLAHPVNTGIQGNNGIMYFPIETTALQTALEKEGFSIDPSEKTGGGVYLTAYFGPSTQTALKAFQRKAGLDDSGVVDDQTADALSARYGCPKQTNTATTP